MKNYICFEHSVEYTFNEMICPKCETKICEDNDKYFKERQMTNFTPVDSKALQEESLVRFMAAVGYEPVYDEKDNLRSFFQPKFSKIGEARVSVNRAITMHNTLAEVNFYELLDRGQRGWNRQTFKEFIQPWANVDALTIIFAGTCKIVEQIKGCGSNKEGFKVHDHNVKFMTKRDKRQYGYMVGL